MNLRTIEIEEFFKNYFKLIHENYNKENFNKISHEIHFISNLFSFVQLYPSNTNNFHYQIQLSGDYTSFNNYYSKSLNSALYYISRCFENDVFYEFFKVIKNIILYKNIKINENFLDKFINIFEKHKTDFYNSQTFNNNLIDIQQTIYKHTLNNIIINILILYLNNYDNFILKNHYNILLNDNIHIIQQTNYYDINNNRLNIHNIIDFKDFNKDINIHNIQNFILWMLYKAPYILYSDVFDILLNHYNFLNDILTMSINAKQNTVSQTEISSNNIVEELQHTKKIQNSKTKKINKNIINNNDDKQNSNSKTKKINKNIVNDNDDKQNKTKKIKKKTIPPSLKIKVWNKHIGDEIGKSKCLCCNVIDIYQASFSCGHIISEHCGGELKLNNLKPICSSCNSSMGTKNMDDYIKEFGY